MKFNEKELPFLRGEKFSNNFKFKVSEGNQKLQTRMEYIEDAVRNKRVIHLGCTDHIPLIEEKIKHNVWFHKRLDEITKRCLGIDIDEEALHFVRKEYGYQDLIQHNVLTDKPHPEIIKEHWDYIVMGEILEHVDNPVLFLSSIREKYGNHVNKIIVSVPNAFDLKNFFFSLQNIEFINTDHRVWFTPYTLAKVATSAGYEVDSFEFCLPGPIRRRNILTRMILKKYPAFRETIVMTLSTKSLNT